MKAIPTKALEPTSEQKNKAIIEMIGAELATAYLLHNAKNNRRHNPKLVRRYADDMVSGHWHTDIMDPIRFDTEGKLVDGQHRLMAITEARVELPFLVVRGVDTAAIHVIDTGKARTPADMLRIAGLGNTPLLASACRAILLIKGGPVTERSNNTFSHSQIRECAEAHPGLQDSAKRIRAMRGIRPSHLVATHYIGSALLEKPEAADAFMDVFNTGVTVYPGDAAQHYREYLLRMRQDRGRTITYQYGLMGMIHAWNLFAQQTPVKMMRIPAKVEVAGLDKRKL